MRQRIRLVVRYDGTDFAGSQVQPGKRTVAGTLTAGLESLLGQGVKLDFASRTDSGVHADGNVAAFDAELPFAAAKLPQLLDRHLPADLVVRSAAAADADFHPRFDATGRTYVYRCFRSADVPVDRLRYAAAFPQPWDVAAVREALAALAGRHCFAAYSASGFKPADSLCDVHTARLTVRGREVAFHFAANRFLRHMVVRLVGALALVAEGRISPAAFRASLSGTRDFHSRPAPAKGLTLVSVEY